MSNDNFALCRYNEEDGNWYGLDLRMKDTRLEALRQQPEFAALETRITELEARTPAAPVVAEGWKFPTFEDWLASPIESPSSPHGLSIQYAKLAFNAGRAAHPVAGSPVSTAIAPEAGELPPNMEEWEAENLHAISMHQGGGNRGGASLMIYLDGDVVDKLRDDRYSGVSAFVGKNPSGGRVAFATVNQAAAEPMPASEAREGWKQSYVVRQSDKAPEITIVTVAGQEFQLWDNELAHLRDLLNTAAPVPASEAASAIRRMPHIPGGHTNEDEDEAYRDGFKAARLAALRIVESLAAPAAPTDAQPDDEAIRFRFFKLMSDAERKNVFKVFMGMSDKAAEQVGWHDVQRRLLTRMLADLRANPAAQSVRDAAQPAIAPGKDKP